MSPVTRASLTLTMLVMAAGGDAAGAAPAAASMPKAAGLAPALEQGKKPASSFVPADFAVPTLVKTAGFQIVPLGPDKVKLDFDAYMSSIEHLQKTFTRSTSWPHKDLTAADAMQDMEGEQAKFSSRRSFAYAVLTPDGKRERGCVYVSPSPVPGYGAVVRLWVTKAEHDAGFDAELYKWVAGWIRTDWPFAKVAYPGRATDWATWDGLVAAEKARTGALQSRKL